MAVDDESDAGLCACSSSCCFSLDDTATNLEEFWLPDEEPTTISILHSRLCGRYTTLVLAP